MGGEIKTNPYGIQSGGEREEGKKSYSQKKKKKCQSRLPSNTQKSTFD